MVNRIYVTYIYLQSSDNRVQGSKDSIQAELHAALYLQLPSHHPGNQF